MNNRQQLIQTLALVLIGIQLTQALKYSEGEERLLNVISVLLTFCVFQLK